MLLQVTDTSFAGAEAQITVTQQGGALEATQLLAGSLSPEAVTLTLTLTLTLTVTLTLTLTLALTLTLTLPLTEAVRQCTSTLQP